MIRHVIPATPRHVIKAGEKDASTQSVAPLGALVRLAGQLVLIIVKTNTRDAIKTSEKPQMARCDAVRFIVCLP